MLQNQLQRKEKAGGGAGGRYPRNRLNQHTYLQLDPQVQADPQEHFAFPQPDMMMMMMVERVSTNKKCQEAIDHTHTHTHTHSQRERRKQTKEEREKQRDKESGAER
jgi:hypothetical protein